ncbi:MULTISPECIES: serine hydrolase domain-containing protein [Streptomyces]|uniref:Beta-lactamase family protein n=1 Tax=Streptomyces changanensis TaxID=2964669 RepID=A0ABY5NEL4_9ACTN|nr:MULTISPECIES: serine hydrolase domain-containing protein [Streptomyces]UUS34458.1 beta-lactamase family protein [Streptomyces changanensis]
MTASTSVDPAPGAPAARTRETDAARLDDAVRAVDAPDVVFALSRHGHRTVRCGGTGPPPPAPRDRLRYELGSASKPYTGLLLAHLVHLGAVHGTDPASSCLRPERGTTVGPRGPITLTHLVTHTSGLPPLPVDFYAQALPRWGTDPYAGYPSRRVVRAFLRSRPRHAPGTRWRYSNFGVAVLGHALAAATATPWEELVTGHVLRPLDLTGTGLRPAGPETDATGHRADGTTPTPPLRIGGFQAAGAVRATPHDLLTFLEAHLTPDGTPLAAALHEVRRPVLRRGFGHRHTHTLTWFRHPAADGGTMYFHSGATSGQTSFLGFRPDRGGALAAVCNRRHGSTNALIPTAYALLWDL